MKKASVISRELEDGPENGKKVDENHLQVVVSIADLAPELRKEEARKPLYLVRYE